ncbi:hypothetical protein LZC95_27505 [Pendulispora brunnea]|uniref:Uncharacterized protein n=1 Tax=Pendulispora brunnea TaxID=2905690 RepID=A0ABZ2JUQ1_9BACT
MRPLPALAVVLLFTACGSSDDSPSDGGPPGDAGDAGKDAVADGNTGIDASMDAGSDADLDAASDASLDAARDAANDADGAPDAATCPKTLLVGGQDVTRQGWTVVSQGQASLTYVDDYTYLKTSTVSGERTSGQLLVYLPGAIDSARPYRIQVVMRVESVNAHNQYDSAAAIMGSFTPSVGTSTDRAQMVYLDPTKIGWADDTQSFAASVVDGAYHTYEFSLDASNVARVRVDGVAALTRNAFTTNSNIAIGDQTNDANVDSAIRIRSVTKLCP